MAEPATLSVLIVEDEPRYRALLEREIAAMGHRPVACGSAEEASRRVDEQSFDVVLLDLHLPGMSGMDWYEKVRERHPQLGVVILTGFGDMPTAIQALRWEAVDFLTKPCGLNDIETALTKVLKAKRDQHAAEIFPETPLTPPMIVPDAGTDRDPRSLADIERDHILAALTRHRGHKPAAAAELGISLRTLYNKLAIYEQQGYSSPDETD